MGEVNLKDSSFFKNQLFKISVMKTIAFIMLTLSIGFGKVHAQELTEAQLLEFITFNNMNNGTQVLQLGNYNQATVKGKQLNLNQIGDSQDFYYTETSIIPSDFQINIEGNENYVEIYGNNQILDKISINIIGDNRNVIIRNYQ